MKYFALLLSALTALMLSGCQITIGYPQATTTTVPPTEATTVPTTTAAPTTPATTAAPVTEAPTPAPTAPPTQKQTATPKPPKTVQKTATPKPPKTARKTAAPKPPKKPAANKNISAQAAKNAALSHAGVKAADARGLRAEPDYDDGRFQYDVEFYANGFEYDYEIDGKTGKVISYDMDRDD